MIYLNVTYQGTSDKFYQQGQLLPENFLKEARAAGYDEFQVRVRSQEGYDHSYYFVRIPQSGDKCLLKKTLKVSTFASDHIHCKNRLTTSSCHRFLKKFQFMLTS